MPQNIFISNKISPLFFRLTFVWGKILTYSSMSASAVLCLCLIKIDFNSSNFLLLNYVAHDNKHSCKIVRSTLKHKIVNIKLNINC